MSGTKRIAVLLLNLGGPLTQDDVKPFLFNLFKDPYIIPLPFGLRHVVAGLISTTRAKAARANYALMGGGSPLLAETQAQADALQARLGDGFKVFIGMRYWHPFVEDTAKDIEAYQPDEIVVLPLYPQFSSTTSLSGSKAFRSVYKGVGLIREVCCYATNPRFIDAHARKITDAIQGREPGSFRLLFSAHGLPEKTIARGDPYQVQVEACVAAILKQTGVMDHVVCYQSRVGPMKWIGPPTDEAIQKAGEDGKAVILIPVAFVSEHIETLVELDIEYRHLASESGVTDYVRVPALRTDVAFIEALAEEVGKALASHEPVIGDHDCAACHWFCPRRQAA